MFDWADAHRPTSNDATLMVLGDTVRILQFHIDQSLGTLVRSKGDRNESFTAWSKILTP